jgi:hypothetical protein
MEPNEDLTQVLSFQLDLLRLAAVPHAMAEQSREAAEAAELEKLMERVPVRIAI